MEVGRPEVPDTLFHPVVPFTSPLQQPFDQFEHGAVYVTNSIPCVPFGFRLPFPLPFPSGPLGSQESWASVTSNMPWILTAQSSASSRGTRGSPVAVPWHPRPPDILWLTWQPSWRWVTTWSNSGWDMGNLACRVASLGAVFWCARECRVGFRFLSTWQSLMWNQDAFSP